MILIIYFSVREGVSTLRQGWGYILQVWNLVGVVTVLLAVCVTALHLSRSTLASQLWASVLHQRESFINFFPLGQQSQVLVQLNAMLLFLLVLKVSNRHYTTRWSRKASGPTAVPHVGFDVGFDVGFPFSPHTLFFRRLTSYGSCGSGPCSAGL